MRVCSVGTENSELRLRRLVERRLSFSANAPHICEGAEALVEAEIDCDAALSGWCCAIAQLLLWDISQLEIARLVRGLSVTYAEKKVILRDALRLARRISGFSTLKQSLEEYYAENDHLNLEGYLRFRMGETAMKWQLCVINAADELALRAEYSELMRVLAAFVNARPSQVSELSLIINPDGGCSITDGAARVDYAPGSAERVISVLIGLSPERLTVYDLTAAGKAPITDMLRRIFAERVRIIR